MCKILSVIGINNVPVKRLSEFLRVASTVLSTDDKDGFGYAAVNSSGLFGERWLNNRDAFRVRDNTDYIARIMRELLGTVSLPSTYNAFGNTEGFSTATSMLLHARKSTNTVNIENTHPFVIGESALIHNGVVSAASVKNELSTCDSELIAQLYAKHGVGSVPDNIHSVAQDLSGWYACAVLSKTDSGYIVDIFKDAKADLNYAQIPELGNAHVYSTSRVQLMKICKQLRFKTPHIFDVNHNTFIRFNALTGAVISAVEIKSSAPVISGRWEYPVMASVTDRDTDDYEYCKAVSDNARALDESETGEYSRYGDDEHTRDVVETIERANIKHGYSRHYRNWKKGRR